VVERLYGTAANDTGRKEAQKDMKGGAAMVGGVHDDYSEVELFYSYISYYFPVSVRKEVQ